MKWVNGNKEIFFPLLTGHAKAFHFVNYELLIAKLRAYGLDYENDYVSPLRSILGSLFFNICIHSFFFVFFFFLGGEGSLSMLMISLI